jgi:hypothetical protein
MTTSFLTVLDKLNCLRIMIRSSGYSRSSKNWTIGYIQSIRILFQLVVINLVDSYCCTDPALYVSALLLSLKTMLQMEFPFINVLTKIDLLSQYGPLGIFLDDLLILAFKLDFYAQVQDLSYLLEHLNKSHRTKRYSALNSAICDLIEDFGLVSFETLAVEVLFSYFPLISRIKGPWLVC